MVHKVVNKLNENNRYDVIIVGGGMVGAATALGLAQMGFNVLVVEKNVPSVEWTEQQPYQLRVSALTRASENILKNLGAWQGIAKRRYHAFTSMRVWDEVNPGEVIFSAAEMDEPNLGYTVENDVIQAALWEQLQAHDKISLCLNESLADVKLYADYAEVIIGETTWQTPLLIGADGAFSKVRELAGIAVEEHSYQQCAVVGCVKTELSHEDACWQRYTANGPFAYLAMSDNVSSIAWYLPEDKKQWALELDDKAFANELEKASGFRLGQVLEVSQRGAFPLVRRHAKHYVLPHLALVGDAAHTIHPQAGQGVNLGLLDAAALVETLSQARQQGKSWGRQSVLRKYERWRRGDNAIVQRSMEGFDWLFKQDSEIKQQIRKPFLSLANRMTWVKNWLMGQALNGREALPNLAKRD
ncbi:UbiH/UbiF/VisC/COQ6 family ubiquinone biosynthesis hydroxylase [Thiomicrorhabdus sediminis]|nr:UbiH/UbiF/VisC/COQ6 family ubiquinone biosynthesis hydroxylase [Thiomicrorhabdus sediminis]